MCKVVQNSLLSSVLPEFPGISPMSLRNFRAKTFPLFFAMWKCKNEAKVLVQKFLCDFPVPCSYFPENSGIPGNFRRAISWAFRNWYKLTCVSVIYGILGWIEWSEAILSFKLLLCQFQLSTITFLLEFLPQHRSWYHKSDLKSQS